MARSPLPRRSTVAPAQQRARRDARAFTIVEVLVSISVIAILIAIAVPAIRGAIRASRAATCLSTIRGAGQAIAASMADNQGQYPYLPERRTLDDAFDNAGVPEPYFNQYSYWPMAVKAYLGDGSDPRPVGAYCPWHPGRGHLVDRTPNPNSNIPDNGTSPTSYYMSTAMFSNWRLWTINPVVDQSVLVPVREDEVAHPSAKLVLIEGISWHLPERYNKAIRGDPLPTHAMPIALADGSAQLARTRDLTDEMVFNPFYGTPRPDPDLSLFIPWINTRDGSKGTDLR